jgi:hypothetical protein
MIDRVRKAQTKAIDDSKMSVLCKQLHIYAPP